MSFIVSIFAWNVPLVSLIILKRWDINKSKETKNAWRVNVLQETDWIEKPEHQKAREQKVLKLRPKFCVPSWAKEGDLVI